MTHDSNPVRNPDETPQLSGAFRERMQQAIAARTELNAIPWSEEEALSDSETDFLESQLLLDEAIACWRQAGISSRQRRRRLAVGAALITLAASLLIAWIPAGRLIPSAADQSLASSEGDLIRSDAAALADHGSERMFRGAAAGKLLPSDRLIAASSQSTDLEGGETEIAAVAPQEIEAIRTSRPVQQAIDSAQRLSYAFEPLHTGVTDMMRVLFENVAVDVLQWSPIPDMPTVGDIRSDSVV